MFACLAERPDEYEFKLFTRLYYNISQLPVELEAALIQTGLQMVKFPQLGAARVTWIKIINPTCVMQGEYVFCIWSEGTIRNYGILQSLFSQINVDESEVYIFLFFYFLSE